MSVSYSPDGRRIVSGSRDKTVRVWDAESGAELAVLRGHEDSVVSVSYSPDGRRIVSGVFRKTMRVWNADTHECIEVIQGWGDVAAIAAPSSSGLRWRAISRDQELVIEPAGGNVVARFPVALTPITTHANGRSSAGTTWEGNHFYIITLEGDPSSPPPERGGSFLALTLRRVFAMMGVGGQTRRTRAAGAK